MNWLRNLRGRVRALFRKEQLDGAMAEEMRSHIEMQMQENIEAQMEAEEARFDALRRFGWTNESRNLPGTARRALARDARSGYPLRCPATPEEPRFHHRGSVDDDLGIGSGRGCV